MKINKGFTLIELFISTGILVLVGIAIYSAFANGINVWHRANISRELDRDISRAFTKLARDLRNTFNFSEIPFEGAQEVVFFPGLVDTASSAESPWYEVGRIAYFFDKENMQFIREVKTYPEVYSNPEIENDKTDSLVSDISGLTFNYCYKDGITGQYKWKEAWKREEQDSIPQAINVDLTAKKNGKEVSLFNKTIFIPIGTGEQKIELGSMVKATEDES